MISAGQSGRIGTAVRGVLFACAALLAFSPVLVNGFATGNSLIFNESWMAAFAAELGRGVLYPRWLEDTWSGAGSPDFVFYAPLPFYLGAPFAALPGVGPSLALTLALACANVAAGVGMAGLHRRLEAPGPAVVAGLVYMLLPYHVLNWQIRMAAGEVLASCILPFFLIGVLDVVERRRPVRLVVTTALLALSHLPTLLIAAIAALALAPTLAAPPRWSPLLRGAAAGALGIAIAAVYVLPALALLDTVASHRLDGFSWDSGLLRWPGLLPPDEPGMFGWLRSISFLLLCLTAVMAAALLLRGRALRATAMLAALVLVVQSPLSAPLAEATVLGRIQFPWRFFLLADIVFALAVAALAGLVSDAAAAPARRTLAALGLLTALIAVAASLLVCWNLQRGAPLTHWGRDHDATPLEWLGVVPGRAGYGYPAFLFEGVPPRIADPRPLRSDTPGAELRMLADGPGPGFSFAYHCPEGCRVEIRRSYWRYWELRTADAAARPVPLEMTEGFQLLASELPPGAGALELSIRWPAVFRLAPAISLAALLAAALLLLRRRGGPAAAGRAAWPVRGRPEAPGTDAPRP